MADLYIVIFDSAIQSTNTPHGREGYYFGETGEHKLYDVAKEVAVALHAVGRSKTDEPVTFTPEECQKYFGVRINHLRIAGIALYVHSCTLQGTYLGTNSRAVAEQGKKLGWKPVHNNVDYFKSIKPEVEALIELGSSSAVNKDFGK